MNKFEIRDPIHGFIDLDDWERNIINHPVFQRLRRINQLGLTNELYPGACHSRFEHSLGVMHIATMMFDHIREKNDDFLKSELHFNDAGLDKDRKLLRLAALLHDIGHAPFSHASEELFPVKVNKERFTHEDYSAAIIRELLRDVIEKHEMNENYGISADEVAKFIEGDPRLGRKLLWKSLLSSQFDGDRADYLMRDSYHAGVAYGKFDLHRLINSLTVCISETDSPIILLSEEDIFLAESFVIARYLMFSQVYYHKTRRAYDHHLTKAIQKELFEFNYQYPPPTTPENLFSYIQYDDWEIYGRMKHNHDNEHGNIIQNREHYRVVYESKKFPELDEFDNSSIIVEELKKNDISCFDDCPANSWYKVDSEDIPMLSHKSNSPSHITYLSLISNVVRNLITPRVNRVYVPLQNREKAITIVNKLKKTLKGELNV